MNLQDNIDRIKSMMVTINEVSELRQEKLLNIITQVGLLQASLSVGGMERLINIVGEDNITKEDKIDFITDVVTMEDYEYISMNWIGEEDIFIEEDGDGVISQIEIIYSDSVRISYYDDYDSEALTDDVVSYESLPDQIIIKIFDIIVKYYNTK